MTSDPALDAFMADCRERVDTALRHWLPAAGSPPVRLHEAMRYATLGDGKRIRPVWVYAAGQALGGAPDCLDAPACAVELIHAYSLVHDDLPSMDDDDLRRGRPTCHKAFDEATALLAGDALQTLAFEVLALGGAGQIPAAARLEMIRHLARAAGSRGMVGGQALDLAATAREPGLVELENIHIHKTGALIRASVRLGTLCASHSDPARVEALDHYAKCVGLAFQVQDDILDLEGDTATLGKTSGKDVLQDKATYPALMGLDAAREKARELCHDALDSLAIFGEEAAPLRAIARFIVHRER